MQAAVQTHCLPVPRNLFEVGQSGTAASLLRWDLPVALYNGGRDLGDDCWLRDGGVGLLLDASISKRQHRGVRAFAHDAWVTELPPGLPECGASRPPGYDYAASRAQCAQSSYSPSGCPNGNASRLNCYHRNMQAAVHDQQAFVRWYANRVREGLDTPKLFNATGGEPSLERNCQSGIPYLYNQVLASWKASDIRAVFYVNDTLSVASQWCEQVPSHLETWNKTFRQRNVAFRAASRAYSLASLARQMLANKTAGASVPLIQYRYTNECVDPRPADLRASRHLPCAGPLELHAATRWFADPPPEPPASFKMVSGECVC